MKAEDLQSVRPGFDDPAMGSQAVFRRALHALSLPGRAIELPLVAQLPARGHGSAALLLLALLDSDSTLWLSPSLAGTDAQAWLRFHTGCRCVSDPANARFLWLAQGDAWPKLAQLDAASDEYPEQSATCIMELSGLDESLTDDFVLTGPGIKDECLLRVSGLPADFAEQWAANHASFPRGVDVFLASGSHVIGLPRSIRLQHTVES